MAALSCRRTVVIRWASPSRSSAARTWWTGPRLKPSRVRCRYPAARTSSGSPSIPLEQMNARIIKALGSILVLGGTLAKGDLLIHDNFAYPDGDLAGNGGGGWTGAWAGTNPVVVTSPGLSFSDAIGNALVTTGSALNTADGAAVTT